MNAKIFRLIVNPLVLFRLIVNPLVLFRLIVNPLVLILIVAGVYNYFGDVAALFTFGYFIFGGMQILNETQQL